MADPRLEFHARLAELLPGVTLYFKAPEGPKMSYPCLIYTRRKGHSIRANNNLYGYRHAYTCNLIYKKYDDTTFNTLLNMPYATYDRSYTHDGLFHDIFTVYQ